MASGSGGLGGVDTEAPTSQPDRTHPLNCHGSQDNRATWPCTASIKDINISGNARVLIGDSINGDRRVRDSASRAEALLEWLHYPRMTSRKESVKDTHSDTFQWILKSKDLGNNKPNPGFRTWLESGNGIYWLAGKAGSGKSTLMKLITEHRKTQEALRTWAGDTVLVFPSFYFWYGGTQMQRSQLGMLRSLLHELVLTDKSLIPVAFPLWTEKDGDEEPDFHEVAAAFRRTLAADKRKICFFIDGLDEYEGDSIRTAALADYLGELANLSPNVKLVVSSRPVHELQVHIKAWPHLMLQDLTSGDISTFVEDKLRRNEQILRLEKQEPTATATLMNELVSRASGVFLWVYVVVQSLLYGLESRDKLADLIVRVSELPAELDELFSVMLERIGPRYRAQAFRLLYITQQLLPYSTFAGVYALVLSYAEEYGYNTKTLPKCGIISPAELAERQQEIEVVVRSRCLGLLEVTNSFDAPTYSLSQYNAAADSNELATYYKVHYIHRTVAEYLDDMDIQARVAETSVPTFDVNVAILNALVITCQHEVHPRFLEIFSHFNRQAEQSTQEAQIAAVDEVDIYLSGLHARDKTVALHPQEDRHWANYVAEDYTRPCSWHDTTLAFAIRCGWELYVMEKLKEHGKGLPAKRGRPLLDCAVFPEPTPSEYVDGMNPKIVNCLLEHGADPNVKFNGYSACSNALYWIFKYGFDDKPQGDVVACALQVVEVMKLLLAYGADKKSSCTSQSRRTSAAEVVRRAIRLLDDRFPQEVRDGLQEVLAIIEDDKSNRGRVKQAAESLSQRIKARLLKRRH